MAWDTRDSMNKLFENGAQIKLIKEIVEARYALQEHPERLEMVTKPVGEIVLRATGTSELVGETRHGTCDGVCETNERDSLDRVDRSLYDKRG